MNTLPANTEATIKKYRMINSGDTLICCVSGGVDSICLLHMMKSLRAHKGLTIYCVHINHQLRKSAERDEAFVKRLCQTWDIPCIIKKVRIKKTSGKSSLEEIAREKRFAQFISIAQKTRASSVVLAHHRDDLAETVLMRILRGTGLYGLQAILPKREIQGMTFIRPLLESSRKDVESYVKKHKLKYRDDPTNKSKRFLRNRIRLELLPLLEEKYNTNIKKGLANLANTTSEDYLYIEKQNRKITDKIFKKRSNGHCEIPLQTLKKLPLSMQRSVLRNSIKHLKGNTRRITLNHIDDLCSLINKQPQNLSLSLPSGISAYKKKKVLTLTVRKA